MIAELLGLRKMNYGCGYDKRSGYLNVDMDRNCRPDLLVENMDLTVIPTEHYDELLALDVIEHIPRADTLSALLDWAAFLRMGGKLILETSDVTAIADMMRASRRYTDHFSYTIFMYGNQVQDGDYHLTGFTDVSLRTHLAAAGFADGPLETRQRWLFYTETVKEWDWTALPRRADLSDGDLIEAVYLEALGRPVDEASCTYLTERLRAGEWSRLQVARHVFQSQEHLFHTAAKIGFA